MFYQFISNPTESASSISSSVYSTYTNTSAAVYNGYSNFSRSVADNCSHVGSKVLDNYSKISTSYPYLAVVADTTNSVGTTLKSYVNKFEPVDYSEEREAPRTHPNENLSEGVSKLSNERVEIVNHILDLYNLKPSNECFKHYDENVIFHDPIVYTTGLSNMKSQFYGLPKIFVKSTTVSYKIVENSIDSIKIDLNQRFVLPLVGYAVVQNSTIILELDENQVIQKHTEYWSGKPIGNKGGILQKGVAKLVWLLVRVPES